MTEEDGKTIQALLTVLDEARDGTPIWMDGKLPLSERFASWLNAQPGDYIAGREEPQRICPVAFFVQHELHDVPSIGYSQYTITHNGEKKHVWYKDDPLLGLIVRQIDTTGTLMRGRWDLSAGHLLRVVASARADLRSMTTKQLNLIFPPDDARGLLLDIEEEADVDVGGAEA